MSTDELTGPYGTARRVPREIYADSAPAALDSWIITAPAWHPLWSQYTLSVITLADVPGVPPARKSQPGVTHELIVMTLNPDHGPYEAERVIDGSLHFLTPGNIAEQFTATDEKARQIAELSVRAVVDGHLNPETLDAPARIREAWSRAVHQTLDHDRDPHHGQVN